MLLAGQQSTFPKLLFIRNRMKIERLLDEGLLLGDAGQTDLRHIVAKRRDRERRGHAAKFRDSMHLHGQALRTASAALDGDAETSTGTEAEGETEAEAHEGDPLINGSDGDLIRRSSMLQEIKRQSGVFFDDDDDLDLDEDVAVEEEDEDEGKGIETGESEG